MPIATSLRRTQLDLASLTFKLLCLRSERAKLADALLNAAPPTREGGFLSGITDKNTPWEVMKEELGQAGEEPA